MTSIAAGAYHSGAVDDEGNAWLWGHGGSWQLGMGINAHECIPQQVCTDALMSAEYTGHTEHARCLQSLQSWHWGSIQEHGCGFK